MSLPQFNESVFGAGKVFPLPYHQVAEHSPLAVDDNQQYRIKAQPAPFANAGPPGVGIWCTTRTITGVAAITNSLGSAAVSRVQCSFSYGQWGSNWLRLLGM